MKKGIYFSLDAIVAIIIATSFTLVFFFMLAEVRTVKAEPLYQFSLDLNRALAIGGYYENAIETGNGELVEAFFRGALRPSLCARSEIFDESLTQLTTIYADNCNVTLPTEVTIVNRFLVTDEQEFYITKLSTWFTAGAS